MRTDANWQEALPTPPPGYRLKAALLTTFDPAQPELLVEHLLPSLLSLSRGLDPEPDARSLYFGELALALERLRGQFMVISSPASDLPTPHPAKPTTSAAYPWLSRYIAPFFTGARGSVTQHSKLWMLHWAAADRDDDSLEDAVELIVSSANLTLSSMKDQLQAGWRARVPLEGRGSRANLATWGPLPRFLEALGESAGVEATKRMGAFLELLSRSVCPTGVQWVASVPGSLQQPGEASRLGVLGLRKAAPAGAGRLRIRVCTPFVGEWNAGTLQKWCKGVGAEPGSVLLSWIDTAHPWASTDAGGGGWSMSQGAHDSLVSEGVQLRRLGYAGDGPFSEFHENHQPADLRWSHAKLYHLQRGRTSRLLVTSANFSASAWGTDTTPPRNFELGVLLDADWPIYPEEEAFGDDHQVFTSGAQVPPGEAALLWGQALWDGATVKLQCRTRDEERPLQVMVTGETNQSESAELREAKRGAQLWEGELPWTDHLRPPLKALFTRAEAVLEVPVLDLRSADAFATTPLPEVDPEVAQALRDALLLESYGGPVVEPEDLQGLLRGDLPGSMHLGGAEDYSVAAFAQARNLFQVVDAWAQQMEEAREAGAGERNRVRDDGTRLAALFNRKAGASQDLGGQLPARLVAEELLWRVEEES